MSVSRALAGCSTTGAGGFPAADEDVGLLKAYPIIQSLLRETVWDDNTPRVTSSLLVFCEDGRWKVMLNDRDSQRVCFLSGTSLAGALTAMEKALSNGSADWRVSRAAKGGQRKT